MSDTKTTPDAAILELFAADGEMAEVARATDWSATPLGPVDTWPVGLRSAFGIMLSSRFSMWMGWGPELAFLYNDGYRRDTIGKKHPWAFGRPAKEVWAEIWEDVEPRIKAVLDTGVATWDEALLLFLERSGYSEETYHTFSYSPLVDDDGQRQGIFCVVMEETDRVISERRLATLRELASELAPLTSRGGVVATIERQLSRNLKDLPFSLLYLFDADGVARLASCAGIAADHPAAPSQFWVDDGDAAWPIASLADGAQRVSVPLADRFADLPTGAWDRAPSEAMVLPIGQSGPDRGVGFLVAALNPYRLLDDGYAGFLNLIGGQITGALASARAYEEERARAETLDELRRDAERARWEAEAAGARLREIFNKAPASIATLRGPTHVFESANSHYLDLVDRRDVVGKPVAEALPEVVDQGFIELLDRVYQTGEPFVANEMHIMLAHSARDGLEDVYLNFLYQPLLEADGSTSGVLVHAVNVSAQVRARQTIEQQANALRDRTTEAESARAEAEEANLSKSRFLATMSHELRTPLNAILGYSDLLDAEISGAINAGQRNQLERIVVAARHLLHIIDEILTFSRIEAGREELRLEDVDMASLVRDSASLIEPLARGKALMFSCVAPDSLMATTDAGKARQILLNLLSNAVKFTDNGSVSLTLTEDGGWMVLTVQDTGIGIASPEQERVFEPFSQVQQSPTRTAGGTGLGLSVTRELAALMGGEVRLESAPGVGSIFSVRLPRVLSGTS